MPVVIRGMRELQAAFAKADKQARREVRSAFREAAEPVRRDAEGAARAKVTNIGTRWPRMRTGVTRKSVYVVPRERGLRGADPRKRPNLAVLMMERAMEPALKRNEAHLERAAEHALDRIARTFNR